MTQRIHLTAVAEPKELHTKDKSIERVFGVQLALEVRGAPEDQAEKQMAEFLDMIPDAEIMRATWNGTDLACLALKRSFEAPKENRPQVMNWLKVSKAHYHKQFSKLQAAATPEDQLQDETREENSLEDFPFFSTKPREAADMRNARAIDLLRAAWRWPAPIAQNAGLVSAVFAPEEAATGQEFLLVLPKGTSEKDVRGTATAVTGEPALYEVSLHIKGEPYEYAILTQDLRHDSVRTTLPDILAKGPVKPDGRFSVPEVSDEMHRLLTRLEERAPSLLWAPTVLGERAAEATLAGHPFREGLDGPFKGDRIAWLIRASTVSMFDVILGGLLLPASNTRDTVTRRGVVLDRLTRFVAAQFERENFDLDVDESALYGNIHAALWDWATAPHKPADIWKIIVDANIETARELTQIHLAMTEQPFTDIDDENEWSEILADLAVELGKLATLLESEEGGESWLIRVLEHVIGPETKIEIYGVGTLVPEKNGVEGVKAAFESFKLDIMGEFDASTALRNEFGSEVVLLATSEAAPDTPKDLRAEILSSTPLINRFTGQDGASLFDKLWRVSFLSGALAPPKTGGDDKLITLVAEALDKNLKVLTKDPEGTTSFQPDDKPSPLWLPIARSPDLFATEGVLEHLSGLGFLVMETGGTPAHLNLIALQENTDDENGVVLPGVEVDPTWDPFVPLPAPGTTGLAIGYTGVPLSSPNLVAPGIGGQGVAEAELQGEVAKMAPYVKADAQYSGKKGATVPQLPDLAFEKSYDHMGFWTPPSGVLPLDLRGDNPFDPVAPPEDSAFWPKEPAWICQRRVAIATTEVHDTSIQDATTKDIHPISRDDPRVVIEGGAMRHTDLFRTVGGGGVLDKTTREVVLHEVTVGAGFALSNLSVTARSSTEEGSRTFAVKATLAGRTLTLSLKDVKWEDAPVWLRFKLNNPNTVLSFADPQNEKGQSNSDRQSQVILLAPDDGWAIQKTRTLKLELPGVSFEVLERWAANKSLWADACGADADVMLTRLRQAQALFEATGHTYAEKIKKLPDPAVSGLFLGLSHSDSITPDAYRGVWNADDHVLLSPYRGVQLPDDKQFTAWIGDLDNDKKAKRDDALEKLIAAYKKLTDDIFEGARCNVVLIEGVLSLRAKPGQHGSREKEAEISVSKGSAAHLRVSPMVAQEYIGEKAAIHARMTELSVGTFTDRGETYCLFGGPLLAVEAMLAPDETAAGLIDASVLQIQTSGRARGYRIEATPNIALRQFSQCDLVTQRWRFLGPPIYERLSPAKNNPDGPIVALGATNTADGVPKAYVTDDGQKQLVRFEHDVFGDRPPSDAEFRRVRLRPADEKTDLGRFDWPERSATYFRHRIELISRYAGALPRPQSGRVKQANWLARVAVLAEPDAAPLVRPQFRTFLPLQQSVTGAAQKGPTPIACVLSEPPYSQLGLADQIDAELVSKNLFEVDTVGKTKKLKLRGIRKEISPDPLLSYKSVADSPARAVAISVEGPVGLHFDQATVESPAWSNCQFLLKAVVPEGADTAAPIDWSEMEESFMGISLSRRADPGWSWFDRTETDATTDIRIKTGQDTIELVGGDGEFVYAEIAPSDNGGQKVLVRNTALYFENPMGEDGERLQRDNTLNSDNRIEVWNGPVSEVLLKALGDNRYRLSLFRAQEANIASGIVGGEALNGSVILTAAGASALTWRVVSPHARARSDVASRAAQSEATLMEWARSTRNFSVLAEKNGNLSDVTSLHAHLFDGRIHFHKTRDHETTKEAHVKVSAPLAQRKYPLHVHRRLVYFVRKPSTQIGREIDLYHDTLIADDWGMAYMDAGRHPHPERLSMIIAEMECRAEILLINKKPTGVPEEIFKEAKTVGPRYQQARFDLMSGQLHGAEDIKHARIHIRAANKPLDLNALSVALGASRPNGDTISTAPINLGTGADGECAAIDIVVRPDEKDEKAVLFWRARDKYSGLLTANGSLPYQQATLSEEFRELFRGTETLTLTVKDATSKDEVWVDVSLLHSSKPFDPTNFDAVDLDWLFGPEQLAEIKVEKTVDAQHLNTVPEVQARIIGLTKERPIN